MNPRASQDDSDLLFDVTQPDMPDTEDDIDEGERN